jgi:hypothetical protein
MTHEHEHEHRGQGPADGKRINARLAAARGHVQGSRQELPKMFAARGAGGLFVVAAVSRICPGWTVRDWAGLRPVVSGVQEWVL